jgi:hypothetical protein
MEYFHKSSIKPKGIYYFLTKYAVLSGWLIIFITLAVAEFEAVGKLTLSLHLLFLLPITLLFIVFQFIFSWSYPHEVELFQDRIKAIGPWAVRRTIRYNQIKKILWNTKATVIIQRWGFFIFYIGESIDPKKLIHDFIFKSIDKGKVRIVENANI